MHADRYSSGYRFLAWKRDSGWLSLQDLNADWLYFLLVFRAFLAGSGLLAQPDLIFEIGRAVDIEGIGA